MKAISVRAPWWWAIMYAGKDFENRDWPTRFRGRVLIHASKWWNISEISDDWDFIARTSGIRATMSTQQLVEIAESQKDLRGYLVGSVEIFDCVKSSNSPWFFGEYGFALRNPVPLSHPIPIKGRLGFFDVPEDLLMGQHYTRNTVEVSAWCKKCGKDTMHRVDGVKLGPCLACMNKPLTPKLPGIAEPEPEQLTLDGMYGSIEVK